MHEQDIHELCILHLDTKSSQLSFGSSERLDVEVNGFGGIMSDGVEVLPGLHPVTYGGLLKVILESFPSSLARF